MELALNLAWLMLAVSMVVLWLHLTSQRRQDRCVQFVALMLVLLVLLPAISVTDDLIAAYNLTEIDTTALSRSADRDHQHVVLPVLAALDIEVFRGLCLAPQRPLAVAGRLIAIRLAPALSSVANRPPPTA